MKDTGPVWLLVLMFLFAGCMNTWWDSADYSPRPNQAEAVSLIWGDYGVTDVRVPPRIGWYPPACSYTDYTGKVWMGFDSTDDSCDQGDTIKDSDVWTSVLLIAPTMHESALAHELCHAASFLKFNDWDGDHVGPCFVAGGLVDVENKKLADGGM